MSQTFPSRIASFLRAGWFGGLVMMSIFAAGSRAVLAEEPRPTSEFREPETTAEPQRTVTAAIYLLIALTVGVVSLLILIMLWGARVRRQARKPLSATSPNDPLWYLKKSAKPPPREPDQPEGVSDETTETNHPNDDSSD